MWLQRIQKHWSLVRIKWFTWMVNCLATQICIRVASTAAFAQRAGTSPQPAVTLVQGDTIDQFVETTLVYFRAKSMKPTLMHMCHGEAWGCAVGYMMEGHGAWLIERIEGDWQNVIGLPIFPLITRLYQLGYRYPIHASTSV